MMKSFLKKIYYVFIDYSISIISVFTIISFFGTFDERYDVRIGFFCYIIAYPCFVVIALYLARVYEILWKYANMTTYIRLFIASCASSGILYITYYSLAKTNLPINFDVCLLIALTTFLLLIVSRYFIYNYGKKSENDGSFLKGNIMVIGGGSAGTLIINDIKKNSKKSVCNIKCIIDDDIYKRGFSINGVTIVGGTEDIISAAKKYDIDVIVFAIPTCTSAKKSTILNLCQKTGCAIKVIPSFYQLLSNEQYDVNVNVSNLREIQIEDLLGRDPINIHVDSVLNYVNNKTIMVTGGGGSIGSELCRQIALHGPKQLIIFDIYENNAYDIQNELSKKYPNLNFTVLIGSVRDVDRLQSVFDKYRPQLVFHAAAHKHVPLMEDSPNESIKNNVFGTYNVANCADKYGVERFILISTDKAVNPTNIMGASKRICEMIIQNFASHSKTEFAAVRFGNVLGSNGSVIPLFKKQIAEGGPVTVTDPNIIRYFMTIPEAVSLVLQAGATAKGGEIFVLDMGEPVKIIDLAENLIRLSGLTPYTDIKIEFIGLRPGEKMYEEKLLSEEGLKRTENSLIHIGKPIDFDEKLFLETLDELNKKMKDDNSDIRSLVRKLVPTYTY